MRDDAVCTLNGLFCFSCDLLFFKVVERVEGAEGTETLLDRLTSAMERFQEQLDRIYRQQKEREDARRLREEQVCLLTAVPW